MALRAVEDMTGKLKSTYLKGLSTAIKGHNLRDYGGSRQRPEGEWERE